jgi:hypothetical protein
MFDHPAVEFVCRHCRANAGHDPEICYYCGPICEKWFAEDTPCPPKRETVLSSPSEEKKSNE